MSKMLGKATWFGAYRLPTDKKDQRREKRRGRRREKTSWRRDQE